MTSFPIDLSDTHVLVSNDDERVATWKRDALPAATFVFTSKKLAQRFHRKVLKKSAKWRVERVNNVADFLGFGVYLRLANGSDMFLRQRVSQVA